MRCTLNQGYPSIIYHIPNSASYLTQDLLTYRSQEVKIFWFETIQYATWLQTLSSITTYRRLVLSARWYWRMSYWYVTIPMSCIMQSRQTANHWNKSTTRICQKITGILLGWDSNPRPCNSIAMSYQLDHQDCPVARGSSNPILFTELGKVLSIQC